MSLNHKFHTNSCEAFHSLVSRICPKNTPKNTPQPNSYNFKFAVAGLSIIFKQPYELYLVNILKKEINKSKKKIEKEVINKMIKRKSYIKDYQRGDKYKEQRRKRYVKRKAIEIKDNSYKKNTRCSCKVNQCITLRCGCFKINNECNELCGCKSCLNGIVKINSKLIL